MSDTVEIPRSDILSLVVSARDYGFEDDVLFDAFADWLGDLSDDEMEEFVDHLVEEVGGGSESRQQIRSRLQQFRSDYDLTPDCDERH